MKAHGLESGEALREMRMPGWKETHRGDPRRTMRTFTVVAGILIGFVFMGASNAYRPAAGVVPVPVLAELFTSEGCSSCPPADELLIELIAEQPIEGVEVIAISEHVDYWNGLGWRDPFSSARFSQRQREYAESRNTRKIYTPQWIIDGRFEAVGSDRAALRRSLIEAAKEQRSKVSVTAERAVERNALSVRVVVRDQPPAVPSGTIRVMVAIVEDELVTDVVRGENARKRLRHHAVARVLEPIAAMHEGAPAGEFVKDLPLNGDWRADRLRVVAFLQDDRAHHVVGVAESSVE
jgi:hypothetical protein